MTTEKGVPETELTGRGMGTVPKNEKYGGRQMKRGRNAHSRREGTKSHSPLALWRRASPRPILFCLVVKVNSLPPSAPALERKKPRLGEELRSTAGLIAT